MQFRAFFGDDRAFNWTDLQTNSTVDAGGEVDPIPIGSFGVFAGTFVNARDGAGINAICNAFTYVGNDRMRHGSFFLKDLSERIHCERFLLSLSQGFINQPIDIYPSDVSDATTTSIVPNRVSTSATQIEFDL